MQNGGDRVGNGRKVEHQPYPVDQRGFPIHPQELRLWTSPEDKSRPINNHHLNFTRRMFAVHAISQTFRDLDAWQVPMYVSEHNALHRSYEPLRRMPETRLMMEEIELQRLVGGLLKVAAVEGTPYALRPISDELWTKLQKEYHHHR
jgi:hypothetical protein